MEKIIFHFWASRAGPQKLDEFELDRMRRSLGFPFPSITLAEAVQVPARQEVLQGGARYFTLFWRALSGNRAELEFLFLYRNMRVLTPSASPKFRAKLLHPFRVTKENARKAHNRARTSLARKIYCEQQKI